MSIDSIPFKVVGEFAQQLQAGEIARYGAILKNVETGKIVGHLQETGIFQNVLQQAGSAGVKLATNPVLGVVDTVANVASVAQNRAMGKQLTNIEGMVQSLSTVNLIGTVASVAGIGVTVASTALILQRMRVLKTSIDTIEDKIDGLPKAWGEMALRKTLRNIETQLERLEEVSLRSDPAPVVMKVEEHLHDGFSDLYDGAKTLVAEVHIDAELLRTLIAGLAVCGAGQYKSLMWLNETDAARSRANAQTQKLNALSMQMPLDKLIARANLSDDSARIINSEMADVRAVSSSVPGLCAHLIASDIGGRHYIEAAQERDDDALLVLPAD